MGQPAESKVILSLFAQNREYCVHYGLALRKVAQGADGDLHSVACVEVEDGDVAGGAVAPTGVFARQAGFALGAGSAGDDVSPAEKGLLGGGLDGQDVVFWAQVGGEGAEDEGGGLAVGTDGDDAGLAARSEGDRQGKGKPEGREMGSAAGGLEGVTVIGGEVGHRGFNRLKGGVGWRRSGF